MFMSIFFELAGEISFVYYANMFIRKQKSELISEHVLFNVFLRLKIDAFG